MLSVEGIRELPLPKLEELVRSSGYFRQKAQRLKNFVAFLDARYGGSLEQMFATPTEQLRAELLTQNGIGPETADAILLYAGITKSSWLMPTRGASWSRHRRVSAGAKYDEIRNLVERALQRERAGGVAPSRPARTAAGSRSIGNEHRATQSAGAGLQRNARTAGAGGKTLLPETAAQV